MKGDYDRFMGLLFERIKHKDDLSLPYYNNKNYQHWYSSLISNKITIISDSIKKPVHIDFSPMKLIKNNPIEIKDDKYLTDILNWFVQGKTKYYHDIKDKYKFSTLKDALQSKTDFFDIFDNHLNKNIRISDKTELLIDYSFGDSFIGREREHKKYSDIFPLKDTEFEGYKFLCPNNTSSYLGLMYGDFNKLPLLKDRRSSHISKIIITGEKITQQEIDTFLLAQNKYFFFANKIHYKFYYLFRQIKSNGIINAYTEIIKPFLKRKLR